jgi:hypothetical protein
MVNIIKGVVNVSNGIIKGQDLPLKRVGRFRSKSPYLLENATRTTPHTSRSLYTKELFQRSDRAVDSLKHSRRGKAYRVEQ